MMIKKSLLLLFFSISSFILLAQHSGFLPGYIIKNSSDTIKGFVKYINQVPYRVLSDIKFKEYENADAQQYSANELIGYKAEDKEFNSVPISRKENSKKFMELIVDGYIKIYKSTYSKFGTSMAGVNAQSEDYLYRTGDKAAFNIEYADWTEKLSQYLFDNKTLATDVRNGAYQWKELPAIIKEYNAAH